FCLRLGHRWGARFRFESARFDHILLRKRSVSMNPSILNVMYLRLDWRNDDHTALDRSHGPPRAPRGELEQTKNRRHRLATCGANYRCATFWRFMTSSRSLFEIPGLGGSEVACILHSRRVDVLARR